MSIQIIGALTKRPLPTRTLAIGSVIVHTTGDQDLDKILRWYESVDGLQPHYVIDTTGVIRRIVFENFIAYHAKIDPAEARLYQQGYGEWSTWIWKDERPLHIGGEFSGYRTWRDQWRNRFQSPLDLITGSHPNGSSIGVELQATDRPGAFTDAQYAALAGLLEDIHERVGVPLDRDHVLGHSDVSPMRRSNSAGGWDPGVSFDWNHLWDLLKDVPHAV